MWGGRLGGLIYIYIYIYIYINKSWGVGDGVVGGGMGGVGGWWGWGRGSSIIDLLISLQGDFLNVLTC